MGQNDHEFRTKKGVTLERTEMRVVHSDIVGQDYELLISLPRRLCRQQSLLSL
jgi:hypothetical protein